MNAFGIDHQETLSVVCLCEGSILMARFVPVSDGERQLIPNAVLGEGLWGSTALREVDLNAEKSDPFVGRPILTDSDAPSFWRGLYRRLYSVLGRVAPTMSNGYRLVVGIQNPDAGLAARVEEWCRAVGLPDVVCIPATDALLCRWMAEQLGTTESSRRVVAVVAVGAAATAVTAYEIIPWRGRPLPDIAAGCPVTESIGVGYTTWMDKVLTLVFARFREPPPPGYLLPLRDAVADVALRLRGITDDSAPTCGHRYRTERDDGVAWSGPLSERLFEPLTLWLEECMAWPEVAPLRERLVPAINAATRSIRGVTSDVPDLILIGGTGAMWPFAGTIAKQCGAPVWHTQTAYDDIAQGAALWPTWDGRYTPTWS